MEDFLHLVSIAVTVGTLLFGIIGYLLIKDNKSLTARVAKNEEALDLFLYKTRDVSGSELRAEPLVCQPFSAFL